jgi:membrane AbrB-like protein
MRCYLPALRQLAETLAVGTVGGGIFNALDLPAGWLSGSLVFVAVAALARRPMHVPVPLARVVFIAIGISLGAVVTPETLHGIAVWPLSVAALACSVVAAIAGSSLYLQRIHAWDRQSALLASAPGALSQVIVFATQTGADLRGIAIVQSIRVVILAACLPVGLQAFGLIEPGAAGFARRLDASPFEMVLLVVCSTVVALALHRLRFPGGLMFGAMAASAILHGTGATTAVLPWWLVNSVMVGLGAISGARFANTEIRMLAHYLGAALGSFAVTIIVTAIAAYAVAALMAFRVADVVVSFAPGALDVMMLLALALHLDPIYVGAHHLARFMVISLLLPLIASKRGNG